MILVGLFDARRKLLTYLEWVTVRSHTLLPQMQHLHCTYNTGCTYC